ncbi:glycoside hydrolase family 31 protein [Streptomyces sp. NPDC008313]|uniref:glycoside hydrolase family 31 protein n=1 Tax=Streptomyces sp. NPDC008313 TaxID=3364826 RepID=UPI0036E4C263
MDGRDLVRSMRAVGSAGAAQGLRTVWTAWRGRRAGATGLPRRTAERARVPGQVLDVEPGPGGGVVRFARSELRIMVEVNGAVFWGWDGARPGPSYALVGDGPEPDQRAVLEPGKDGGWRVVAERVTVTVSRHGAVEVRTPGGVFLRRDLPPRWWEPTDGGRGRWMQRTEVSADARFFGLGGRTPGPRLRDGTYRLWNADPGRVPAGADTPSAITMPLHMVVSDAATCLVFHDSTWDGTMTLREGAEGAGSGHDRAGTCELRMDGGPLRCWVMVGTPARVLRTWASLTGAPALPPAWALGHHRAAAGPGGVRELPRIVAGHREHRLPLDAVHVDLGRHERHPGPAADPEGLPRPAVLAEELRRDGIRLVSVAGPAVPAEPGDAVYDRGVAEDVFVRDGAGGLVRSAGRAGVSVYPDFTHARVRVWWGRLHGERLGQGYAGFWYGVHGQAPSAASAPSALPLSARHFLEGDGGDHREAHNVYALCMARAGHTGLRELAPRSRPFLVSGSGWAGMQRYGGAWPEEVTDGWPGLRASLSTVLGLGLCGVPHAGAGTVGPQERPSPELYLRRLQLGAYLPLFRTEAGRRVGYGEPWEFGEDILEHARVALLERRRLTPYLMTLAHLARRTGAPVARPVWWGAPDDRALRDCEDAFLLGNRLLVAPVTQEGAVRRAVRLPRGRWYDTVTEEPHTGPGQVMVDAPLSRIPVLARAGSVLPVRGDDGGVELEVWPPASGRTGGGLVIPDEGDGCDEPEVERYTTRWEGNRLIVERDFGEGVGGEPCRPVRVRGLGGDGSRARPAQM